MRNISKEEIKEKVKELCILSAYRLPRDVETALRGALKDEKSALGKEVLEHIVKNFEIAASENVPMCQDTGITVVFVEMGRDVSLDGSLEDAINEGVREGYREGYLRKSVCNPITRKNTEDNTPAVIHVRITEGDRVKIAVAPKGAGSENMSRLRMLKPSDGIPGVKDFVVETVKEAGGNPCPPVVVGVGIGGNFEEAALLAKKALFRPLGKENPEEEVASVERELLERINRLGIGPMGFGGVTTALAVHIETLPCHIASLPVAVNIQCHADRHMEAVI